MRRQVLIFAMLVSTNPAWAIDSTDVEYIRSGATGEVLAVRNLSPQASFALAASLGPVQQSSAQASAVFSHGTASLNADIRQYAPAFGIKDPELELLPLGSDRDGLGMSQLRFQQMYRGVPVYAAELNENLRPDGIMSSLNGRILPHIDKGLIFKIWVCLHKGTQS